MSVVGRGRLWLCHHHLHHGVAPSPLPHVNQPVETDVGYDFGCVSVVVIVAVILHLYPESLPPLACR